jgi:hypothetical protein
MESAQKSARTIKTVLDNVYVSGAIKIFIILYAVLAAPKLPSWISKLFHHSVFQVVVFALIAYTATKDVGISLLIAVAFFVSFHSYTKHVLKKVAKKSTDALGMVYKTDGVLESNYGKHADDMTVESGLSKDDAYLKADAADAKLADGYIKTANQILPGFSGNEQSAF